MSTDYARSYTKPSCAFFCLILTTNLREIIPLLHMKSLKVRQLISGAADESYLFQLLRPVNCITQTHFTGQLASRVAAVGMGKQRGN